VEGFLDKTGKKNEEPNQDREGVEGNGTPCLPQGGEDIFEELFWRRKYDGGKTHPDSRTSPGKLEEDGQTGINLRNTPRKVEVNWGTTIDPVLKK